MRSIFERFREAVSRISGRRVLRITVAVHICACIDTIRIDVSALMYLIHGIAKQVRLVICFGQNGRYVVSFLEVPTLELTHIFFLLNDHVTGETQVMVRPTHSPDYFEDLPEEDESSESDFTSEHNSIARMVITATIIFGILLIIVVIAIICMCFFHRSKLP